MKTLSYKPLAMAVAVLSSLPMVSSAAALERSNQSILPLFEDGNYAEVSYVFVDPDIPGSDFLGNSINGSAAEEYGYMGAAVKVALGENSALALIYDQPFGVDYNYTDSFFAGTSAEVDSDNLTLLVGTKVNPNNKFLGGDVWMYAGSAYQNIKADVVVDTAATAPYSLSFEDEGMGWLAGMAYEKPEIALRLAATYRSEVDFTDLAREAGAVDTPFNTQTPASVNLDFQTGITPTTLLMVNGRWINWTAFEAAPQIYTATAGEPLVSYDDDQYAVSVGVGQKLTDTISSSIKATHDFGSGDRVTLLGPYENKTTVSFGLKAKLSDMVDVSGGIGYTWLGGAEYNNPAIPASPAATYDDGDAISAGGKIGFHF